MTPITRIAFCFALVLVPAVNSQTLEITPGRVMVDQAASIRATGLSPGGRVSIHAELTDGADVRWASQADFVPDAEGSVDTARQAPAAGSYKGVSAMGLVWSMTASSRQAGRYTPPRNFGVQTVEFKLMRGSAELAGARLEQSAIADGVTRVNLHEGALRGILFLPPGAEKHPALLVLGGSEGGMPTRRAAWFASHGYAALALAYFRFEDLPPLLSGIPLEYFGKALSWMASRPEIDSERMGVEGVSRGAELALQLGSMYPAIRTAIAYSPSNVRNPACCGFTPFPWAWTFNGSGLAFRPIRTNDPASTMRAAIDVEQTHGPILLISGDADRIWESSAMADSIVRRLKEKRFAYPVEHLKYTHAGHGAGRPEIEPAWVGVTTNPTSGRQAEMGGSTQGNAEATLDAIPKVLEFLGKSLQQR